MNHDWNSQVYNNISSPQYISGMALLRDLDLSNINVALDIGCGNGNLTLALGNLIPKAKIIGVDISKSMVDMAIYNTKNVKNIEIIHADFSDLSLTNKVDFVFSNKVLHWMTDQQRVFEKMYSILNNNGKFVASFGIEGSMPEFRKICNEINLDFEQLNLKLPNSAKIINMLELVGFTIENTEIIWDECKMSSKERYLSFVEYVLLQGLNVSQQERHGWATRITELATDYSFNFADISIIAAK